MMGVNEQFRGQCSVTMWIKKDLTFFNALRPMFSLRCCGSLLLMVGLVARWVEPAKEGGGIRGAKPHPFLAWRVGFHQLAWLVYSACGPVDLTYSTNVLINCSCIQYISIYIPTYSVCPIQMGPYE